MNQKIQELLMSGKIEEAMQAAIAEKKEHHILQMHTMIWLMHIRRKNNG